MSNSVKVFNFRQRGTRARQAGVDFEENLKRQCNLNNIKWIQIPSGFKGWKSTMRPCKTYFDFILIKDSKCIFIDCKNFESKRMSYSQLTEHQVNELHDIKWRAKCEAGYLVYFRLLSKVIFFDAYQLKNLKPLDSLSPEEGIDIGSLINMDFVRLFE